MAYRAIDSTPRSAKTGLAVAVAAALLALGVQTPATAQGTPSCVSRPEFQQFQQGMSKLRVYRITDAHGWRERNFTWRGRHYQTWRYRPCSAHPRQSVVVITYIFRHDGRVLVNWKDALFR
jgi:hypothetical protein